MSTEEWEREYTDYNLKENIVKWYIDGAKTSRGVGAGIYGPSTKCALSVGSCMSVFQAEILAIERCLDMNLEINYQKYDIAIYLESQAAMKALSSYVICSKMIWDCRNELNEVGKKNNVFLIWVPGHSGIKGNEKANTLAKEGARMSLIGPEPFCGIVKCTYKKKFLKKEKAEMKETITPPYWLSYRTLSQQEAPVEDDIVRH